MAVSANDAENPVAIVFGVVENEKPIAVRTEQRLVLTEEFIVLTDNVRDIERKELFNIYTEGAGYDGYHNHAISGVKTIKILNSLKVGDKVVMLRLQGGNRYIVLDRVVE